MMPNITHKLMIVIDDSFEDKVAAAFRIPADDLGDGETERRITQLARKVGIDVVILDGDAQTTSLKGALSSLVDEYADQAWSDEPRPPWVKRRP
jgi:hypothetical protein